MSVSITPETKIAELLEAYPQLEHVLIQQAPHFRALKNPILRKTVARVATLEKAAQMAGIPVRALVTTLRQALGLTGEVEVIDVAVDPDVRPGDPAVPEWYDGGRVRVTIDADALLAKGEVPLPQVHQALQGLLPGDLLRVTSTFRPTPLLEALHKAGHRTYTTQALPNGFQTYVLPRA